MNKRQDLQSRSITDCVRAFRYLPAGKEYAELRRMGDRLAEHQREIAELTHRQYMAVRARSGPSKAADDARREIRTLHLIPVARRAKRLFRNESTILRVLTVPQARATLEVHAAAALAMAKALRPHAKLCHEEGFRVGFITELKTAGTKLLAHTKGSAAALEEMAAATRQLKETIRNARELAAIIDVELTAANHGQPDHYAENPLSGVTQRWARAYRLGKPMGRPKKRRRKRPPREGEATE